MEFFSRCMQLFRSLRPQLTLAILAIMGYIIGDAPLRTLAEVSLKLAPISLSLCRMRLVVWRVCGI
jgi:hypothetical protein